jgi:tripartite-type tricarboxylate transporter receptor subunit TctC
MIMFVQAAAAVILASIAGLTGSAYAQEYPTKPIRLVVPWPAGGVTDVVARIVGERLGQTIGKPMVIDNKAGASGFIGTEIVAKAPPDGYTLLLVTSSTHAASPALFRKIPYDPLNDFATISQVTLAPTILVVPPSLPANSVAELVTLAKAKPGQINYASYGSGSTAHLAAELFLQATGTSMAHIPYKGAAPAVTDLIGGHVSVFFDSIPSSLPHVRSGKLKALAVTGPARTPAAPDIPTVAETYPGFEVTVWQGFQAPAGTPRAIIDKLNANIVKVMAMSDVREKLMNLGADPVSSTPEQFAQHIAREKQKWADVVKRAGIPLVD